MLKKLDFGLKKVKEFNFVMTNNGGIYEQKTAGNFVTDEFDY